MRRRSRRRAAERHQRRRQLGVAQHEAALVVGEPHERRTSAHNVSDTHSMMDCILRESTVTPSAESRWPYWPSCVEPSCVVLAQLR